jgi:hypothetical protein
MANALKGNTTHFKLSYFKNFFEHGVIKGIEWQDLFKFAFVRNPYDRMVSAFFFNKKDSNDKSFKEFVFDMYLNNDPVTASYNPMQYHPVYQPQSVYIVINGVVEVGFLGRSENIESDWKKVCNIIGEKAELPHVNQSKRKNWEDYYDKQTREWVHKIYKEDFINFGYGR